MASLIPIPDPDPDRDLDPDPDRDLDSGLEPEISSIDPAGTPEPEQPKRKLLGKKKNKREQGKKLPTPFQPYIAAPAPKSYGRDEPAIDVDEHRSRTTLYTVEDAIDAAAAKLRCLNAWIRMRKRLFEGDPNAVDPTDRKPLLARERFGAQKLAQLTHAAGAAREAAEQVPEIDAGDRKAAKRRRDTVRDANQLAHRAMEIEYRLNLITHEIDTAAQHVYDELAVILGYFWLEYERRAKENEETGGKWRTREAASEHSEIEFAEHFGAPQVPSVEEINELIRAARDSYNTTPGEPA
jgi:hypothetical protein